MPVLETIFYSAADTNILKLYTTATQRHVSILGKFDKPFSALSSTACVRDISCLAGKIGKLMGPPM